MSVFGENALQRFYDYLQRHGLIGGDAVFLVHRRTPGVVAANAHLLGSNAHPCVPDTGQLIQMQGVFQLVGAVGYDNALYFSRLFRKHIGMSPREYRRAHVAPDEKHPC